MIGMREIEDAHSDVDFPGSITVPVCMAVRSQIWRRTALGIFTVLITPVATGLLFSTGVDKN